MKEFENLKNAYTGALQYGIATGINYNEAKHGNDILHKFCENMVENSNYDNISKDFMKNELEIIKELMEKEIETFFNN